MTESNISPVENPSDGIEGEPQTLDEIHEDVGRTTLRHTISIVFYRVKDSGPSEESLEKFLKAMEGMTT